LQQHSSVPQPVPGWKVPDESHLPSLQGSVTGAQPHWPAMTAPHVGIVGKVALQSMLQAAVRLQ
jgi:hypothetical protein